MNWGLQEPLYTDEWKSMDFNWRSPVIPRIAILVATLLAVGYFLFGDFSFFFLLVFVALAAYQIKLLVRELESSNLNIASFLDSIRFDDLSASFKTESNDPSIKKLHQELNEAIINLRNTRKEKDADLLFFKNIVMHVGIGLIVFKENGKVEIINTAARRLLRVNRIDSINDLSEVSETLVDTFQKLRTGGRELTRTKIGEDFLQLSVYAIELTLRGENLKLISLQNIQSELEEKEMEAWQNLVRVLTHEIMNSVTPISSLADMVEEDLGKHLSGNRDKPVEQEQLEDIHLSLKTISKRSEGLINFVKEFRSLASVPKPKTSDIEVKPLLDELCQLHKKELSDNNIQLTLDVAPTDLKIHADKGQIEQVIINLVKNAIQAFDRSDTRMIDIKAFQNEKMRTVISVKDNGTGIEPEALEKIFIPFFTTKKSGSGIGLSLSRQIMRQHKGSLTVKSTVGAGTEFLMRF
jgi:two-component system, NtrC family, nitrogen regulation sensor histidine kinase NtrY